MEVAIYFWSSNFMCLSVSTLHSSVIMKNQLLIPFSGCCLVVCLFVCSWSKTGSREPLLQSILSSSFFVFIDAFHSKLNKLCVPLSNNPSSLLSSPIKYAWNENASRELNRAFIAELHTFARAWAEPHSLVNLPIPENLVIMWPYTERTTIRPHHRHTNVYSRTF